MAEGEVVYVNLNNYATGPQGKINMNQLNYDLVARLNKERLDMLRSKLSSSPSDMFPNDSESMMSNNPPAVETTTSGQENETDGVVRVMDKKSASEKRFSKLNRMPFRLGRK